VSSLVLSGGAGGRAGTHFVFGEGEALGETGFVATLENATAQQRQLLYLDAVSPYQSEIGPDGKCGPYAIRGNAFKREHAASQILSEARENELHLCAPSRTSLQFPGHTGSGRHARLGERRLQVGPYS
jgi:hypothetical protein